MRATFCLLFFWIESVMALGLEEVVRSSQNHYPQVIESLLAVDEAEQKVRESRGTFDAKAVGGMDARTEGYYPGDSYKLQLEKEFPLLNSKLYGGVRQSYGDFPVYEGKMETLSRGETFAGLSVSLLRDSLIDFQRYRVTIDEQERLKRKVDLEQVKIDVQTLAIQSYWMWVVRGYELKVYQEILGLAEKRAVQIKKRIRAGDLARIYETENNQYIQKRRAQVLESQAYFKKAQYYLSLFYRDQSGRPRTVEQLGLPPINGVQVKKNLDPKSVLEEARTRNLDVQKIQASVTQAKQDIRMGRNAILPKVDLNFEWNQDQGVGPNRLTNDENRILLKVEIPIEYRKGLGKKRQGEYKKRQLEAKQQLVLEKLRAKMQALLVNLNTQERVYAVTRSQVDMAEALAKAEMRKFSQGASDLILVNIREENLAEAKVKNLETRLKFENLHAELLRATVTFL